jgi:hypothetical protein
MKEIFLSYSRRDSSTVQALAAALEEKGVSVWIDRSGIEEGDAYDTQIEEAIARTRVVIVVWSQHSVRSHWVRAEAAYALNNHKLMPIAIDNTEPPLQFHHIQTISFDGWDGAGHDEAFTRLLAVLAKRLDRAGTLGEPALGETAIRSKEPVAPPQANAKQNRFVRMFATGLVTAGLRFPEKVIEREFRDYFRDRTYMIAQVAFLLVFITYIIYGVSDLASEAAINSAGLLLSELQGIRQAAFTAVYCRVCGHAVHLRLHQRGAAEHRDAVFHRERQRHDELHADIGGSRRYAARLRPDSPGRRGHKRAACADHDAHPDVDELAQLPSCQLDVDRGRLRRLLARISDAAFVRRRVVLTEQTARALITDEAVSRVFE